MEELREELRLSKELRTLTIDPEFRDLIPPLSEDEYKLLEDGIVANGCESPLFIWAGIIVDGHNRYEICQKHKIPFAVVEKDFVDRDAALMWIIQTQLGRRNLTSYQKGELALRFEPLIKAQAKERLVTSTGGNDPRPVKNSAQAGNRAEGKTREQLGKLAGVSHDTIKKVKKLTDTADDDTKQKLRRGEVSIHKAYTDLMQREHAGELKVCERCRIEKPFSDFSIPSKHHGFSSLCKQCEAEVEAAAKAAADVASQTTDPVETAPISSMVMHKGAPVHVCTPLPDEPGMFEHILDLVKFAGDGFLANLETAMRMYTVGMASDTNSKIVENLLDDITSRAEQIIENKLKELDNK